MFSQIFPEIKVKVREAGLRPSPPCSAGSCWLSVPTPWAPATLPGSRANPAQLRNFFLPGGKLRKERDRKEKRNQCLPVGSVLNLDLLSNF